MKYFIYITSGEWIMSGSDFPTIRSLPSVGLNLYSEFYRQRQKWKFTSGSSCRAPTTVAPGRRCTQGEQSNSKRLTRWGSGTDCELRHCTSISGPHQRPEIWLLRLIYLLEQNWVFSPPHEGFFFFFFYICTLHSHFPTKTLKPNKSTANLTYIHVQLVSSECEHAQCSPSCMWLYICRKERGETDL